MPENYDAWQLWLEVQTQWRAGPMGLIGLDYQVVYKEAERCGIPLTNCTMKKIKRLESETLKAINSDAKS